MATQFLNADDGVKLAYERIGEGPPVVLVHGFGSSRRQNWKTPGWYDSLMAAGFSVLALDCRGHGESDKPHETAAYGHQRMAEDVRQAMDAAGLERALLCGYSMGGFIGMRVTASHPARVARLVVAGVGAHYLHGPRIADPEARDALADALLTDQPELLTDPRARMFRAFADQPGKDRVALAACMRAMSPRLPSEALAQIEQEVLVVCGEKDDIAGEPFELAAQFRHGSAFIVPARDHTTAVGDRKTRQAVTDFFRA